MNNSEGKIRISDGRPLSKVERYLERGLAFFQKQNYDDALADLDEAIRLEKRNAELYATRGFVLQAAGYTNEAETDFQAALKIDPSQWIVHYARGIAAFDRGDYDAALGHFSQGINIVPLRPELYIYRAAAYFRKGEKSKAMREIDSAMQSMQPGDKRSNMARKWRKAIKKMKSREAPSNQETAT